MLADPSWWVLAAGAFAFAIQVFADFSAYSDIARGSARLLGFELIRNFNTPYLALTLVYLQKVQLPRQEEQIGEQDA